MLLNSTRQSISHWGLLASLVIAALALSAVLVKVPILTSGAIVLGVIIFIVCFVSTEASLYLLIFSMLLSPEIGMGGLGGGGGTTASRGLTIRTEDLLLLLLGFAWLVRMAVHKELGLVRQTPLNHPIGYYIAINIFSTGVGMITGYVSGKAGFFFVLKYIEYFVLYFIVANNIQSRAQIKRFTIALLLTALIVSLVAMAQIPTGERVSAPFEGERGEPNTLGGYLLFMIAMAVGLILQLKKKRDKWLLGLLTVVMFIPFLATLSRGSYLGLPFVYLVLVALNERHRGVMILILIVVAVLGAVLMPRMVIDRITYTFTQQSHLTQVAVGGVKLDTSTSARIESWENALRDVMDSPVWGFGVTGYGFLDAQYPRILVETGLVGLLLFGLLILALFREAIGLFQRARDVLYRGLAMGLLAGLVGLLVHGVGSNTFIIVRIMEPFWLVVGMAVSAGKLEGGKPA